MEDILVLDRHAEVVVWVGQSVESEEKQKAFEIGQSYMDRAASLEGLPPKVHLYKITEENEPCFFTTYFSCSRTLSPKKIFLLFGAGHAAEEFMILLIGASSFKETMKMGVEVYHHLKAVIKKKYGQDATNVGDEGGFAPNIQENEGGLELLKTTIAKAGYTGKDLYHEV